MNLIDLKLTLRSLQRYKFYTILSIMGIALTFIFISIVLMYIRQITGNVAPEIYKDRTIALDDYIPFHNGGSSNINAKMAEYYKQLKEPETVSLYNWQSPFIFNGNSVLWTPSGYVDSEFFNIFHFKYISGRPFNKNEEENKTPVLIMAKEYAQRFFRREDVLGEKIEIQGTEFTIIGVFEKPNYQARFGNNDLYIPRTFNKYLPQGYDGHSIFIKARNKSDIIKVSDEINRLHQQLHHQRMLNHSTMDREWSAMSESVSQSFLISITVALFLLLLIPAFNILSLNTGKIMDQIQETSIKRAYGATRRNILKNIFMENTILTFTGAILGLLLTFPFLYALNLFINSFDVAGISLAMNIDIYVIIGLFILIMAFSLLSCFIPARKVTHSNIIAELKGGTQ